MAIHSLQSSVYRRSRCQDIKMCGIPVAKSFDEPKRVRRSTVMDEKLGEEEKSSTMLLSHHESCMTDGFLLLVAQLSHGKVGLS
jgi:hypothetical protein